MIKIEKGAKPAILDQNAESWTQELDDIRAAGGDATAYQRGRYNNQEIKSALIAETGGKCAYCESKILHIDFGDIEHILPKKERPDLWFDWENLTLACSVCNNKKRAYYDEALPLLDPYEDETEIRLLFFGPLARWAIGDAAAQMTERTLGLNREKLVERRTEKMDQLRQQLEVWRAAPDALKPILESDFRKELQSDREYASMARTIARSEGIV